MVMLRDFVLLLVTAALALGLGWLGINALTASRDKAEPPAQTKGTEYLFDEAPNGTKTSPPEPPPAQPSAQSTAQAVQATPPSSAALSRETASAPAPKMEESPAVPQAKPSTGPGEPAPPSTAPPRVTVEIIASAAPSTAPASTAPEAKASSGDAPGSTPKASQDESGVPEAGGPEAGTEKVAEEEPLPEAAQTGVSVARVREVEAESAVPAREAPAKAPSLSNDQRKQIEKLLAAAERDMKTHRLTTPGDNNARDKYERVLELDPGNQEAREGLEEIVHKYLWLAKQSMDQGLWARAGRFITRAENVLPGDPRIQPLKEQLNQNRDGG